MARLLDTSERILKGNTPLVLDRADDCWQVHSGMMAVFAVVTVEGQPQGARRYLFDVNPGDCIFGIRPSSEGRSYQLLAVAYEETQLLATTLDDRPDAIETWYRQLALVFEGSEIHLPRLQATQRITDQLDQLHNDFLCSLYQLDQQEEEERAQRFQDRQRLNQKVSERAIGDLTAAFRSKSGQFDPSGADLLVAAGAVGHALGIDIRPPARSEDLERVKDPLDAIARASRIRTRRVILAGEWWKADCGAVLAYTAEEERPVAILPKGAHAYEIFDPKENRRIPIDADTMSLLSPVAFMFYRPLPDRLQKALKLFQFALRGRQRDIIMIIILGIAGALMGMLTPQATGIVIDKAIPDANRNLLFQVGFGLIAVNFGTAIFEFSKNMAISRAQTIAHGDMQAAVWDRLLKLKVPFFREYSTGDLQSRVSAISQINNTLSGTAMRSVFSSFFSLLNLGLLISYNAKLALVAVGLAVLNIAVTLVSSSLTRKQMRPLEQMEGELFGLTVQLIGGVSKLRVSGSEERAFAYWARQFSQQTKLKLSTEAIEDFVTLFNTALPTIGSILIFLISTTMLSKGDSALSTGAFLAFNSAFGTFVQAATDLSNTVIDVNEVSVLWDRAKPILEATPEVDASKTDPGRLMGGVKLERVSFRYRADGPLNLDKVTVEAKPGEFIAFVGPSGSGKSTTLRLLLGFEQPEEGTVYYDGQDLSGLDVSAVRRQLGVVLQNGRISSASIFENISGGALVMMDEAWEAARMAGFAEDVENMPMGMHTVISEGGTNLSGGQRQRLLISRALVLKPKFLIFDEATSALDNRTQAIVSESLDRLSVTRIVIAHRLSTIRNADRIYVIAAGQVVQQGNFDELMAKPGVFADLMSRQVA
jgi:NHLM bacteriocin system ABC transporter ATP-binding protein